MLNFDGIMKDALEVGLLTTSELDRLTDEVASGAKTEATCGGRQNADTGGEGTGREVQQRERGGPRAMGPPAGDSQYSNARSMFHVRELSVPCAPQS